MVLPIRWARIMVEGMNIRRQLLQALGGALLIPSAAVAARKWRIGIFSPLPFELGALSTHFRDRMSAAGFREGSNVEYLFLQTADGPGEMDVQARELVSRKPDVILTLGARRTRALVRATSTIPIVTQASDPVGQGFAHTLGKPGMNVTGISINSPELWVKAVEAVRAMEPRLKAIADISFANEPEPEHSIRIMRTISSAMGLELMAFTIRENRGAESIFKQLRGRRAVVVLPSEIFHRALELRDAVRWATANRVPTISIGERTVAAGLLVAYTPGWGEEGDTVRHLSEIVVSILRGGSAATTPFRLPTRLRLAINVGTARAIGLAVPAALLLQAEEVFGR
jgi:putative ABC transport system substrate-binding protein